MKVPSEHAGAMTHGKSSFQASRAIARVPLSLSLFFFLFSSRRKPENISVTVTRGISACRQSETSGQ
jgi:hypothetical protein